MQAHKCRIDVNFAFMSLPIIPRDSQRKYNCNCYYSLVYRSFRDGLKDKITCRNIEAGLFIH